MHPRRLLPLVLAVGVGAALAPAATADSGPISTAQTTQVVVVRPVTSAGTPATGFRTKKEPGNVADCSVVDPSPGAVDPNIEECSPSAAYAIACWKSATAHRLLCIQRLRSHQVVDIKRSGKFASTPVADSDSTAPLLLILNDGTKCSIRDGGAWGVLKSRPKWSATYGCSKHGDIWAKESMAHLGVDESADTWTVHTATPGHGGKLTVRRVAKAYFVGTAG